jgi:hypothetical protein
MISGDEYSHLMLNGKEIFKTKSAYMVLNDDNMGYFKNKQYVTIKLIISFVSFEPCLHNEYYGYCNKNIIADFSDKNLFFQTFLFQTQVILLSTGFHGVKKRNHCFRGWFKI